MLGVPRPHELIQKQNKKTRSEIMKQQLMLLLSVGARNAIGKSKAITRTTFHCLKIPISSQSLPCFSTNFLIHCKRITNESITKPPKDEYLLQVLQSELAHEQSNRPYREAERGVPGPFVIASDLPDSQDVVLRRSYDREDIAITALLDPEIGAEESEEPAIYPRVVLMKICITKPGISPVLLLNCRIQGFGNGAVIDRVSYLESPQSVQPFKYWGPVYSCLDPELQHAFREFLQARGVDIELANFLLVHLHSKEQRQYVQWLQSVESIINKESESG